MNTQTILKETAFSWVTVPIDKSKANLVLVRAKTPLTTRGHIETPQAMTRNYPVAELREAGRTLAGKRIGLNHEQLFPKDYYVIDSQWNETTQAVEALVYVPSDVMQHIRHERSLGRDVKWSVESRPRRVKQEADGSITPQGIVFSSLHLIHGKHAGDPQTATWLLEELELDESPDILDNDSQTKGVFMEMTTEEVIVNEESTEQPVEEKPVEQPTEQTETQTEEKPNEQETNKEEKPQPVETTNESTEKDTKEIDKPTDVTNEMLAKQNKELADKEKENLATITNLQTSIADFKQALTKLEETLNAKEKEVQGLNSVVANLQNNQKELDSKWNETLASEVEKGRAELIAKFEGAIPQVHNLGSGAAYFSLVNEVKTVVEEMKNVRPSNT